MISANDIFYGKINPPAKGPTWGLCVHRFGIRAGRILCYAPGLRMAIYDDDFTTVIYNDDLPTAMNGDNCEEYRFAKGKIVYDPVTIEAV